MTRLLHGIALTLMLALAGILADTGPGRTNAWIEQPMFQALVQTGQLPPIALRVPQEPRILDLAASGKQTGRYGGELRMLLGKQKDIRFITVYGYARLIGYDPSFHFVPDILADFRIDEGRIFTFVLRKGHKWSDGAPFTSEDFRYYWQDVLHNKELSPGGLPRELLVNGKAPEFQVLDEHTIRYSWDEPNPEFLAALAGASPLYLYQPAHYLKQFHQTYRDADEMAAMVQAAKVRNWAALHYRKGMQYRPENPQAPTLQPWRNITTPPADQFIFERNPYFHRVDTAGHQLPYIDRLVINLGATALIPAKTGSGDADLQARYIRFDNYTFLKEAEKRHNLKVLLWKTAKGAQVALYPNLNAKDPAWREVMRDARFRRALSVAIDRHEINQIVYYGLVRESADTILPESPLFKPELEKAWSRFDIKLANALLDGMGLTKRNSNGIRLLPDGRPMELIVETAGESTEEPDILELIRDSWRKIGVELFTRYSQRDVFRNRIFSGDTLMSVWSGMVNAVPGPDMSPAELAPTSQQHLQWPMWGQYFETSGKGGEPPANTEARQLLELYGQWRIAAASPERRAIWERMLAIYADQVFSIGIVNGTLQPVVHTANLRNVPEQGVYNWDPGAYFGMYLPDTFWLAPKAAGGESR